MMLYILNLYSAVHQWYLNKTERKKLKKKIKIKKNKSWPLSIWSSDLHFLGPQPLDRKGHFLLHLVGHSTYEFQNCCCGAIL